jgi:hypothetical protein
MDKGLEDDVRRMLDVHAIEQLVKRYGRAADRVDRDAYASFFHPDALEHHGTFEGRSVDFVDYAVNVGLPRYMATTHLINNTLVEVDGDRAVAESNLTAAHLIDDDQGARRVQWFFGRLLDRLERRQGEWRVVERTVVHDWNKCEPLTPIDGFADLFVQGKRDRNDPVYETLRGPEAHRRLEGGGTRGGSY